MSTIVPPFRPLAEALLEVRPRNGIVLNDEQSRLNATRVHRVIRPTSVDDIARAVAAARRTDRPISVAGGRHAMGAQQFGTETLHLDMTDFRRVIDLDSRRGLVTVEGGIQWPELIAELHRRQPDAPAPWVIREKQTGVDTVSIAGSLSANIHGRGLTNRPFVQDIESFDLVDARGRLRHCSRRENADLFALAIGGYGLFGIVAHVTLRLTRRFKVRRRVEVIEVRSLIEGYRRRVEQGFVFGDCQYAVDFHGDAESHCGVFSCYEPVPIETPIAESNRQLTADDWARLYRLIRTDKQRAFEEYAAHYRATDGQVYWSDTHQLAGQFVGHRAAVEADRGTEMITEVYVSHENALPYLVDVRADLEARQADISYGTIRFIERDGETFLPWATERSVCIVCNLHVRHTPREIARARASFRQIIDRALEYGGRFYLTYHRWATPAQVEAAYPRIREFYRRKRELDPDGRFQSDWYRQYAPHFV